MGGCRCGTASRTNMRPDLLKIHSLARPRRAEEFPLVPPRPSEPRCFHGPVGMQRRNPWTGWTGCSRSILLQIQPRSADRQPTAKLHQLPPRLTRREPDEGPLGSVASPSHVPYQSVHHSYTFPCMSYSPHAFGPNRPTGTVPFVLMKFAMLESR